MYKAIKTFFSKKVVGAVVLATVFLTACAGADEFAVQGVTDTTVRVGNSVAVSGPLAPVGVPFQAGMNAYFLMVNEGGGINGRTIEYIHQDDGFDPVNAIAILEGLINDDQVFAIVGHFGTPVIGATLPMIIDAGIPAVYFAAGTGVVYMEQALPGQGDNIFPVQPVFPMEGRIMAAWASGVFNANRLGVIFTNDDAGIDLIGGIEQEAAVIGGMEIISAQVAPGSEDVSAAVTTVLAGDVDMVVIASIQGTFPQIARELANQGSTVPALTSYVNVDGTMVDLVAADIGGQYQLFGTAWVDLDVPEILDYQYWVARVSSEDFSANAFAITGWIAAHFFVEGLRRVGTDDLNWESYIVAMESAPIRNPFGGYIDFSNGQRVGTQEMSLALMDGTASGGWVPYIGIMTMQEILN
ncbi:MAG: ABC transporter substrate-binding protein [Defluviitaleaceae bacterium]|nr:ABC transporter substrate-binding protein [Defluviitaleaceae bacterium]